MQTELTLRQTQCQRMLKEFKIKRSLTNVELNNMHIYRYSARIKDLRKDGYRIVSEHIKGSLWRFVYKGHEDDSIKEFDCD